MRSRLTLALVLLSAGAASAAVRPAIFVGIGFPELLHAEIGLFVHDRLALEVRGGNVLFNMLVGAGATGYLLGETNGRPPRHALLLSGDYRVNVYPPLRLDTGGERLGSALGTGLGYGFTSTIGFSVRLLATILWYWEKGVALGATATLGVGWVF